MPPSKWTKEEVVSWINRQGWPTAMTENVLSCLKGCDGEDLSEIKLKSDLDKYKIEKVFQKKLFKAIQNCGFSCQAAPPQNDFNAMVDECDRQHEGQDDSEFVVYFAKARSAEKESTELFNSNHTIYHLKDYWIRKEEGGELADLIIGFNGKQYDDTKNDLTLGEIGIKGPYNNHVHIIFKTNGGAQIWIVDNSDNENEDKKLNQHEIEKEKEKERKRYPNFKNEKRIKPTLKCDDLIGYDEQNQLRVEMPCGHVFAPVTLYQLTQRIFELHNKYNVYCPIPKCKNREWPFECVIAGADFNKNELSRFQRVFNNRKIQAKGELQSCPNCKNFMKRGGSGNAVNMQRVRCTQQSCKNQRDFCWTCGQAWKGGGFSVCGNDNCSSAKINKELAECETIHTAHLDKVDVPCIRACPRCLAIVQWKKACKHMKCWNCKKEFCFLCLALKDNGKWGCKDNLGGAYTDCGVAKRQVIK